LLVIYAIDKEAMQFIFIQFINFKSSYARAQILRMSWISIHRN